MAHNGSINYLKNQRSREEKNHSAPQSRPPSNGPRLPRINWSAIIIVVSLIALGYYLFKGEKKREIGEVIYTHNQIPIFYNGDTIEVSHGNHYSTDGYYYGQKWQCVEFVKRYLYEAKGHAFPNPFGNAIHFYKPELHNGQLNVDRGMLQFHNGGNTPPKADDVVIFNDSQLGHVAIVAEVGDDFVEVVQQNMPEDPLQRYELVVQEGKFYLKGERKAAGWLRLPANRVSRR